METGCPPVAVLCSQKWVPPPLHTPPNTATINAGHRTRALGTTVLGDVRQGDERTLIYLSFHIFTRAGQFCIVVAWERCPRKAIPYALPWTRTLCPALNLIFSLFRHSAPQSTTIIFPTLLHTVRTRPSRRPRQQRAHCSPAVHLRPLFHHLQSVFRRVLDASRSRFGSRHIAHHASVCRCLNPAKTPSTLPSSLSRLSAMKASRHPVYLVACAKC